MIEFTKAFKASDGKVYSSLEEAQASEIGCIVASDDKLDLGDNSPANQDLVCAWIVANKTKIVDILTTTESSRPRARKANGGTKKRKPSTVQTSETSPT